MKNNFKIKALPLAFLAVLSQTACVDPENKRLKGEQECQVSRDETYGFMFTNFLDVKKIVFKEIVKNKVIKEQTIVWRDNPSYGLGVDLPLTDEKNQNYYQIIVDDRYLFTLSEIKIYAFIQHVKFSDYIICAISDLKVNGEKRSRISDSNFSALDKKDAIILPVANSKK